MKLKYGEFHLLSRNVKFNSPVHSLDIYAIFCICVKRYMSVWLRFNKYNGKRVVIYI